MKKIRACFDMAGKIVGYWKVLKMAECPEHIQCEGSKTKAWWLCVCNCGNKSVLKGATLRSGRSLSCGCRQLRNNYLEKVG